MKKDEENSAKSQHSKSSNNGTEKNGVSSPQNTHAKPLNVVKTGSDSSKSEKFPRDEKQINQKPESQTISESIHETNLALRKTVASTQRLHSTAASNETTKKTGLLQSKKKAKFSRKSHEKISRVFEEVDVNDDRLIDWEEIVTLCENLQIKLGPEDEKAFKDHDFDENGGLDLEEFVEFVHMRLKRVFEEIDIDKSGEIEGNEIHNVMEKLGIKMTERQINAILSEMDQDGNGKIDFKEFCDFFSDVPTLDVQHLAKRWMCGEGLDVGSDPIPAVPPAEMPLIQFMVAGAVGGTVARTFCAPLEKIKMIAQVSDSKTNTKIKHLFNRIVHREGIRGLFNGNLANCLRIVPTGATVGLVYSRMLKYTPVDSTTNPHQPHWRLFSGACAGVAATVVTHPLDVVRACLTVQDTSTKNSRIYTGIINAFKTIYIKEGARGWYKGLTPALQSVAPMIAIQQSSYDMMKLSVSDTTLGKHPATFLTCGALAGLLGQTVVHPLEIVRRLQQVETTPNKGTIKIKETSRVVLKRLWLEGGMKRLYAGITAVYLKVIPSAAISLLVRDAILGRLNND